MFYQRSRESFNHKLGMKKIPHLLSLMLLVLTVVAARGDLTNGLVSYWPLDATDGVTTPDVCFSNNPLSRVGGIAVVPGMRGNAFQFNSALGTYLTNLHSSDRTISGLPIYPAGSYTITMWVKGTDQTAKYLYTEGNLTTTGPIFILQTGNAAGSNTKLDVIIRNDQGTILINHLASATAILDATGNNWHHIAWVDNFGSVKLYVDGVLDTANYNYTPSGTMTVQSAAIGTLVRTTVATGNFFNGQIDDVSIWERALSQAEVNQIRTNGIPTPIVPGPPLLTAVPANTTRHLGDWYRPSVSAISVRPHNNFTYQWSRNGSPVTDATNSSYLVTGLVTNNTGDYFSVTVSNDVGGVTTTNATLTVLDDAPPALTNGIVDYWPLDVITQPATDLISPEMHFGQNMVLRGFVDTNDYVAGQFSNALAFDFVSKYAFRTNGSAIYPKTNYSVSLWVKGDFTSQNDRRVFSEGSSSPNANPLFTLGTDNTGLSSSATVFVRSDTGVAAALVAKKSTRAVFDNNWHHLAWTDANGQGKLYVDGTLDETDYTYTRSAVTVDITSLGAVVRSNSVGNFYLGDIDEVATWARVLSWTEIQQLVTNGVPVLQGITSPGIAVQPLDLTNGVYVGDDVGFSVTATGTEPLVYQWRKNGTNISGVSNPSALTSSLVLTNVQVADSNTTYSVVVTNAGNAVTSSVVHLYVIPWTPVTTGLVVAVDIGLTGSPNPQPGFAEMTLGANPATFANTVRLTLSAIGTTLAERNRIAGAMVVNNPPFLTQAQIYNDFIFANNATVDGTGLRLLIERIAPNTTFAVTIWSFDPQSVGLRSSSWTETASGTPITINPAYTFDGSIQPVNDFEDTVGGLLTSTDTGKLQIEAVRAGGTSFGAFIDAVRLVANPTPHTRVMRGQVDSINPGNILITAVGEWPGQLVEIEQTTDLQNGPWVPAVNGSQVSVNGCVVTMDFPIDPAQPQMFYRGKK